MRWPLTKSPVGRLAAIGLIAALTAAPATAHAETPELVQGAAAVAYLNAQREANGIPPFTSEEASLASWCPDERGGVGGSGDRVLSADPYWDATISPWAPIPTAPAPFHEALIYDPVFTTVGEVNAEGPYDGEGPVLLAACASVANERPAPSTPEGAVFYSALGSSSVPPAVIAFEDYTPAQALGLPAKTGPNLIVYAIPTAGHLPLPAAPHASAAVTLTSASGESVANIEAIAGEDCFIIVPPPLQPSTEYSGEAQISINASESVTDKLHFSTGPEELGTPPPATSGGAPSPSVPTPASSPSVQPPSSPPPATHSAAASVAILAARLTSSGVTLQLRLGAAGITTIRGYGFKALSRTLAAGEHQVTLSFTRAGKASRKRHTPTILSVTVNVAGKPVIAREKIRL
jgi:hypothetical protein